MMYPASQELWLPAVAICAFVTAYSLLDVLKVGHVRAQCDHDAKKYDAPVPEVLTLALRAQANQVEQLPGFLVATLLFALFVNGTVAGVLALAWSTLRILYARTFRASVGVPFMKKGLGKFTVPCYFILNSMATGVCVHLIRYALFYQ